MSEQFGLSELTIYPVKSMQGIACETLPIDDFGPRQDRRFMLVDKGGRFVTQRQYPLLSQFYAHFDGAKLRISGPEGLEVVYLGFSEAGQVSVWGDSVVSEYTAQQEQDQLISEALGVEVRMVHMPESTFRQVDKTFYSEKKRVSFADGFPFLLCNTASLEDLNALLEKPVTMRRFRPNIVVKGSAAFEEDRWKRIRIGAVEFALVKPCSRCVMTTIDEQGNKGREPLRTLASYRRNDFGVCFGQNMVAVNEGVISLSDTLEVLE